MAWRPFRRYACIRTEAERLFSPSILGLLHATKATVPSFSLPLFAKGPAPLVGLYVTYGIRHSRELSVRHGIQEGSQCGWVTPQGI